MTPLNSEEGPKVGPSSFSLDVETRNAEEVGDGGVVHRGWAPRPQALRQHPQAWE